MDRTPRGPIHSLAVLAGIILLVAPGELSAQSTEARSSPGSSEEGAFRLDGRAGIALPTGDMRDYVDEGLVLGAGVAREVTGRLSVRADWTASLMRPADREPLRRVGVDIPVRGSETELHHLTGGVQIRLSEPGARIEVRAHGGAGVTFLSTEETELVEGGEYTQFTLDGGLELAVPLTHDVRFIGRGDIYVLPFRAGAPRHLWKEVVLPFSGGLAVSL